MIDPRADAMMTRGKSKPAAASVATKKETPSAA
jgi:hypothetical protein